MLAVNKYTQDYVDTCRRKVETDASAYKTFIAASRKRAETQKAEIDGAIARFEPVFFNNMLLALENYFVHRTRALEKKDGNALNEVRLLCDSIVNNGGRMRADKSIKLNPETSVLKHKAGEEIRLSAADFAALSDAFFAELAKKFM